MKEIIYKFTDFSDAPGARYRKLGKHSGEEFREDILKPLLVTYDKVIIDGTGIKTSFNPSFLSEAFYPLSLEYKQEFHKRIVLRADDNPRLGEKLNR